MFIIFIAVIIIRFYTRTHIDIGMRDTRSLNKNAHKNLIPTTNKIAQIIIIWFLFLFIIIIQYFLLFIPGGYYGRRFTVLL